MDLYLEGLLLLIEMEYTLGVRVGSWAQIARRLSTEAWDMTEVWWEFDTGMKLIQDRDAVSRVYLRRIVLESLEEEVRIREKNKVEGFRDTVELKEAKAALRAVKHRYQDILTPYLRALAVESLMPRNYQR